MIMVEATSLVEGFSPLKFMPRIGRAIDNDVTWCAAAIDLFHDSEAIL